MIKKILFPVTILFAAFSTQAQSSGTLMFGTNIIKSIPNILAKDIKFDLNLQTKFAFFATNQFAFGLCLETKLGKNETVPFGLTFNSRYYTAAKANQTIKLFVEAGIGLADNVLAVKKNSFDGSVLTTSRGLQLATTVGAGINIFPAQWIALEIAPEYRYVAGAVAVHRLGISGGFKLFLTEKTFTKTFPNKFHSLY